MSRVTPAGQQLLGHGVLPRGLGPAHAGGHRVLRAWSAAAQTNGHNWQMCVRSGWRRWPHVVCQQLTVNRTRPLLKWNTVIKWKAMRSLTLTSGKWANDRQNIKIYNLHRAFWINIGRFVWTATFTHHRCGVDYVLRRPPGCMSRSSQVTEEKEMFLPPPPPLRVSC